MDKTQKEIGPELKEKIMNKIKKKWRNAKCPYCGGNDFAISKEFFRLEKYVKKEVIESNDKGIKFNEFIASMDLLPVSCCNCKATTFINATMMIGSDTDDEEIEDKGE